MPSQINVQLTGRVDNLIFYKAGDKYYVRTVPGKGKTNKSYQKKSRRVWKSIGYWQIPEAATAAGDSLSGR